MRASLGSVTMDTVLLWKDAVFFTVLQWILMREGLWFTVFLTRRAMMCLVGSRPEFSVPGFLSSLPSVNGRAIPSLSGSYVTLSLVRPLVLCWKRSVLPENPRFSSCSHPVGSYRRSKDRPTVALWKCTVSLWAMLPLDKGSFYRRIVEYIPSLSGYFYRPFMKPNYTNFLQNSINCGERRVALYVCMAVKCIVL